MYIYSITNRINGKVYIGRTKNDVKKRWRAHLIDAKNKKHPDYPLYKDILEHGEINFSFDIIEKSSSEIELADREAYYILHYDTISPRGYNQVLYQEVVIFSPETRERRCLSSHRNDRNREQYRGVTKNRKNWATHIVRHGLAFTRTFSSKEEAAKAYDRMALYFYGKEACLNFPDIASKYSNSDLEATYIYFTTKEPSSSKYKGVHFCKKTRKWKATIRLQGKCKSIGSFKNEIDAAERADMGSIYYLQSSELNFPDKLEMYRLSDFNRVFPIKTKNSKNIFFDKGRNKYEVKFNYRKQSYHCGRFNTLQEAQDILILKRKEIISSHAS